jgi:rSAM/selenodomain-associated transferase 2
MRLTTIIVPTLNEVGQIEITLAALAAVHGKKEIIVADGGSQDATVERAKSAGVRVLHCSRGRGQQMREAAAQSTGDVLWFLHADTIPPVNALDEIQRALTATDVAGGSFSLTFAGQSRAARQMTWIYPHLRKLGLIYGDSGIFIRRQVYEEIGGFRPYPLFEDLDLVRRMKQRGRFARVNCPIVTSSRRFEAGNYGRAWTTWIALQLLYWIGVPPTKLAQWYRHARQS